MHEQIRKWLYILPCWALVVSVTTIALLAFRWIVVIHFGWISLPRDLFVLWFPLLGTPVIHWIWIDPRLKIVAQKRGGGIRYTIIQGVILLSFGFVICVSQLWLEHMTDETVTVSNTDQLHVNRHTRFIRLTGQFQIDGTEPGHYISLTSRGRYHPFQKSLHIYFVMPFVDQPDHGQRYWLGLQFHKSIDTDVSKAKRRQEILDFYQQSKKDLYDFPYRKINYFEIVPANPERIKFLQAAGRGTDTFDANQNTILRPYTTPIPSHDSTVGYVALLLFMGAGAFLALLLATLPLNPEEYAAQQQDSDKRRIRVMQYVIPRGRMAVIQWLIWANIIVFLFLVSRGISPIHPDPRLLLGWGASYGPAIRNGQWWRLLTSLFVHTGIWHLFFVLFPLFIIGLVVTIRYTALRVMTVYILAGLAGNLTVPWLFPHGFVIGGFGGVMGLAGTLLVMCMMNAFDPETKKTVGWATLLFVGVVLIGGLLLTSAAANTAHLAGLGAGIILSWLLFDSDWTPNEHQRPKSYKP